MFRNNYYFWTLIVAALIIFCVNSDNCGCNACNTCNSCNDSCC